jgi:hypothetical protein
LSPSLSLEPASRRVGVDSLHEMQEALARRDDMVRDLPWDARQTSLPGRPCQSVVCDMLHDLWLDKALSGSALRQSAAGYVADTPSNLRCSSADRLGNDRFCRSWFWHVSGPSAPTDPLRRCAHERCYRHTRRATGRPTRDRLLDGRWPIPGSVGDSDQPGASRRKSSRKALGVTPDLRR